MKNFIKLQFVEETGMNIKARFALWILNINVSWHLLIFIMTNQMKKAYFAPTSKSIRFETEGTILNNSTVEFNYNNEYSEREQLSNQKSENWSSESWANSDND